MKSRFFGLIALLLPVILFSALSFDFMVFCQSSDGETTLEMAAMNGECQSNEAAQELPNPLVFENEARSCFDCIDIPAGMAKEAKFSRVKRHRIPPRTQYISNLKQHLNKANVCNSAISASSICWTQQAEGIDRLSTIILRL
jgi:hypothetical protein